MPARSTSKYSNRNTETKTRPNSPFHLTHNRLKTNSLVFWSTRRPRCTTSCAQVRPLAAVQRDDNGNRAALLPEHRRQTAYIRRQKTSTSSSSNPKDAAPTNTTSTAFLRRCPGKYSWKHCIKSGDSKTCTSIARLCHRIRLFPPTQLHIARNKTRFRPLFRRAGQRDDRIRRGRSQG